MFRSLPAVCTILIIISVLLLPGCAPQSQSGRVYTQGQARTTQQVFYGTILRVEEVTIEGSQSGAGAIGGAVVGGLLGSMVGGGKGSTLAAAGGAIAGGLAGSKVEKNVTTKIGVEIEVELDNGAIQVIVQEKDDDYRIGDRIRIVKGADGTSRVRQ